MYCNININDGRGETGEKRGRMVWLVVAHLYPSLHLGAHLIAAPPPKKTPSSQISVRAATEGGEDVRKSDSEERESAC